MANGPQKPDHRGNFYMTPRRVVDSVAWRCASLRARAVLQVFQDRHNGFNNGDISLSIKEIGAALGDQNHAGNSRAVAELIELGFLECTSDAAHSQAKARTYRITFIGTGEGKRATSATHEYQNWRPQTGARKKFGGARSAMDVKFGAAVTATRTPVSVVVTTTPVKFRAAVTATQGAEIADFQEQGSVAVTAPLLSNHLSGESGSSEITPKVRKICPADSAGVPLDELRAWVRAVVEVLGYGGQKTLANNAAITQPALTRFRQGRSLPEAYRLPLQEACGRALPYNRWKAAAA